MRFRHRKQTAHMRQIFSEIYRKNLWENTESRSGIGSSLARTAKLRLELAVLLQELHISTLLDIPCGDFNWMQAVPLGNIHYIGADIVEDLILDLRQKYKNLNFLVLDITGDRLPHADLILCRDCLFHLTFEDIFRAVANIRKRGAKYLLTTTFLEHSVNVDTTTGGWRTLNMESPPFSFPRPMQVIVEGLNPQYPDKSLGLWQVADLRHVKG